MNFKQRIDLRRLWTIVSFCAIAAYFLSYFSFLLSPENKWRSSLGSLFFGIYMIAWRAESLAAAGPVLMKGQRRLGALGWALAGLVAVLFGPVLFAEALESHDALTQVVDAAALSLLLLCYMNLALTRVEIRENGIWTGWLLLPWNGLRDWFWESPRTLVVVAPLAGVLGPDQFSVELSPEDEERTKALLREKTAARPAVSWAQAICNAPPPPWPPMNGMLRKRRSGGAGH